MQINKVDILNTHINNLSLDETLILISKCIEEKIFCHVVSLNVDQIIKIEANAYFKKIVDDALVITDGTPVMWVAKLFGNPIKEKIPGPLLSESILKLSARKGYKVFFLGAAYGVADKAAENMLAKYPELSVVGTYSPPYGFEKNAEEITKINNLLLNSNADILFVALSAPKQETFVFENQETYKIPVSLSIGAAIDFMAGNVKRAPNWINKIGLEWFFRFLLEPKRLFKRYFINDMKILKLIIEYRKKKFVGE